MATGGASFAGLQKTIEDTLVVGAGATAGAFIGAMVGTYVPIPVPGWVWAGAGAGVLGGTSRTLYGALRDGTFSTYKFSVNANTGLAVGALVAFMQYSNIDVPILGSGVLGHGLVAGAIGGWFV